MHANIACFLYVLSQNLNEPEKHPALRKHHMNDESNAFWSGVAAFIDKRAFAAAYQKHPAEIGKAALRTIHRTRDCSGTARIHRTQGPATLFPTSQPLSFQVCPPRPAPLPTAGSNVAPNARTPSRARPGWTRTAGTHSLRSKSAFSPAPLCHLLP